MRKKKSLPSIRFTEEFISRRIYLIRGVRVMLDFDLAFLFGVETRVLKQAVRRNPLRFPKDFMFILTKKEWKELITICDNLPSSVRYSPALPMAFTEQGIAMLSSVLNSERAIAVNIQIIREFVKMRQMISSHKEMLHKLAEMEKSVQDYDEKIILIFQTIKELLEPEIKNRKPIGFKIPSRK